MTRPFVLLLLALGAATTCDAQKLPDSQDAGLRAPGTVKVDGKPLEWPSMQAFSKSTQVNYTVANDDSTLYLVVQSTVQNITNKILSGGITLSISTDGRKKDKGGISITFPVPAAPRIVSSNNVVTVGGGGGGGVPTVVSVAGGPSMAQSGSAADIKRRRDSLLFANTTNRIKRFTEVKVLGVAAVTDTLLSIYNDEGIKARAGYEEGGLFTYELGIPLKYLGLSVGAPKEFLYNVKLNGLNLGGGAGISMISVNGNSGGAAANDFMNMMSPTDFWGRYTLVK